MNGRSLKLRVQATRVEEELSRGIRSMNDARTRQILKDALFEWEAGQYYEAHELLEELVEEFEENSPSFEIALALVHVAACFHKVSARVGISAVPGKLDRALRVLKNAPAQWYGLLMEDFVRGLTQVRQHLEGLNQGKTPLRGLQFPAPRVAHPKPDDVDDEPQSF